MYDARDIYLEARNLARMRGRRAGSSRERSAAGPTGPTGSSPSTAPTPRSWPNACGVPLPLVVMNCSYRFDPPGPRERRFHDALGLAPDERVVLYHGGLFPHRGIEELIDAIADVPSAHPRPDGLRRARADAARARGVAPRPAAGSASCRRSRPDELLDWVACADVVAMPIQPSTLNHRLTTPNKLFEAMAAGVPVVASDLPGMATIVRDTGCGVLCDPADPAAISAALRAILEAPEAERLAFGRRGLAASHTSTTGRTRSGSCSPSTAA